MQLTVLGVRCPKCAKFSITTAGIPSRNSRVCHPLRAHVWVCIVHVYSYIPLTLIGRLFRALWGRCRLYGDIRQGYMTFNAKVDLFQVENMRRELWLLLYTNSDDKTLD